MATGNCTKRSETEDILFSCFLQDTLPGTIHVIPISDEPIVWEIPSVVSSYSAVQEIFCFYGTQTNIALIEVRYCASYAESIQSSSHLRNYTFTYYPPRYTLVSEFRLSDESSE
jgi:hypothetical protein